MEKNYRSFQVNIDGMPLEIILDKTFKVAERKESSRENEQLLLHIHPFYEFFFVGGEELRIVTQSSEHIISNAVVVLPPNFRHYSVSGKTTYRFLAKPAEVIGESSFGERFYSALSEPRIYSAEGSDELMFYLKQLDESLLCRDGDDLLCVPPLLTLILISALRLLHLAPSSAVQDKRAAYSEYLFEIEEIIAKAFSEKIDLSYVAERLYLSKKQVSRIIKRAYGTTLSELLAEKRLAAAAKMLAKTDKPVAEIISMLNFPTDSYFFVRFKKKYGMTPLAYRHISRKNEQILLLDRKSEE